MNYRHVEHFVEEQLENADAAIRPVLFEIWEGVSRAMVAEKACSGKEIPPGLLQNIRTRLSAIGVPLPQDFPLRTRMKWYCEDTM